MFDAVCLETQYLTRAYETASLEAKIGKCRAFAAHRHSSISLSDCDGGSSPGVPGSDYPIFGKDEHRTRALDFTVDILDSFHEVLPLDDKQADQFGDIDLATAEFGKIHSFIQEFLGKSLCIVNPGNSDKCKTSQM